MRATTVNPVTAALVTAAINLGRIALPSRGRCAPVPGVCSASSTGYTAHFDSPRERNRSQALRPKLTLQASNGLAGSEVLPDRRQVAQWALKSRRAFVYGLDSRENTSSSIGDGSRRTLFS